MECIVYSTQLKPPKTKGQFPEITYTYIAEDSMVGWHYTITKKRREAYIFDDSEINHAQEIASFWDMKVQKLN